MMPTAIDGKARDVDGAVKFILYQGSLCSVKIFLSIKKFGFLFTVKVL